MQLVFVHGFGCSASDWSELLRLRSGFGDAAVLDLQDVSTDHTGGGSLIVEMANRVNAARGADAKQATVLIGHSMGCRVVLEAARRRPDTVEGLILIEGSLRAVGDAGEAVGRYLSRSVEENKALLMRDFAGMFSHATPVAFRESVLRRAAEMDGDYAVQLMADMTFWDAAEAPAALRAVRVPTLVVQSTYKEPGGKRRPIGPEETSPWLRLVAEQSARSQVIRLTGLGHFPQVEAPETVSRAIADFIASLAPKTREHERSFSN